MEDETAFSFSCIAWFHFIKRLVFLLDSIVCFSHCRAFTVSSENSNTSPYKDTQGWERHLNVRKIFIGEGGSAYPPILRMTSVYAGHAPIPHTTHRTPAGNGFVLQGPWGAHSRGWRPSRAGPFSHGQLLHSRRVSKGKTWTWNDPTKQSPRWVHLQATAPVPLTPKFSCFSIFSKPVFPNGPIHFPEKYHSSAPPPLPASHPPFLPLQHQQPPPPSPLQSHLVNSFYPFH